MCSEKITNNSSLFFFWQSPQNGEPKIVSPNTNSFSRILSTGFKLGVGSHGRGFKNRLMKPVLH